MQEKGIGYNAEEYARTKKGAPFREVVEFHTIFTLIGDPTGLTVVDAGCGDGIYARELITRGAQHVMGVDCDREFIDLARRKNSEYQGRIEYHQEYVQNVVGVNDRDLVVGSYVLSYPKDLEEAIAYCTAMASHLKNGGRFVGFNNNPFDVFDGERYAKYGFRKIMNGSHNGAEVVYWVDGMTSPIVNFYLSPQTYEQAFREAGFSALEWRQVLLAPTEQRDIFWNEFFRSDSPFSSPFVAMTAEKK